MLPNTGMTNLIYIFGAILAILIVSRIIFVALKKRNKEEEEEK